MRTHLKMLPGEVKVFTAINGTDQLGGEVGPCNVDGKASNKADARSPHPLLGVFSPANNV